MRTHNITTLTSEIYDTLARNTDYEQFNPDELGLERLETDETNGKIFVEYQDKSFEITITERNK